MSEVSISSLISERKRKNEEKRRRDKKIPWEQRKENIIEWTTLYRRNWNLYAVYRLMISLYPFQHVMLYLMGISNTFFAICSRGLSKTFIVGLGAMIHAMLYPYAEVVITSSTIGQAKKMVEKKMENELCKKLSPVLQYYYEHGDIKFSYTDNEIKVEFSFNNSFILVLPCLDSSRGERATMLIYEECRLLKKTIIDSVFQKMAHPRQAKFLTLPEYQDNEGKPLSRWLEECKSMYITSARFKIEWFWTEFKKVAQQSMISKKHKYNIFAGNIFLAILFGLKTWNDYFHAKEFDSDIDHRTEDLNEMVGEADGAFFALENFRRNQIIYKAYKPPTTMDIYAGNDLGNRHKIENEKRFIFVDYAFANTTSSSRNDNSVIGCLSLIFKDGIGIREVDYVGTHPASDSIGFNQKIREFFFDYQADYLVLDLRNGGEVNYNDLTVPFEHPERDEAHWNNHGFTVSNELKLHVVPNAKLDDLRSRTVDPQAIPCIIPIVGTQELNSIMWLDLQKSLMDNHIHFLVDELALENMLEDEGIYYDMTTEERAIVRLPYIHTLDLIGEAISLDQTWSKGMVSLKEPTTVDATKDKIVALSYCNHIAKLVENKYAQDSIQDNSYEELIQLVF